MTSTGSTSDLTWDELAGVCRSLADGAFMASVQADGRPHLAWVGIGWGSGVLWTATYRSSQKARNVIANPDVALHWPEDSEALVFLRARARAVTEDEERNRLWSERVLPYDQEAFYGDASNPELLYLELTPTRASIQGPDPSVAPRRWRAG